MKKILVLCTMVLLLSVTQNVFAEDTIYTDGVDFYVIKNDNTLWAWSETDTTETSPKKIMDDVMTVSGNYAVQNDHSLWTWNDKYKTEKIMDDVKYVSNGGTMVLILKDDNTLWGMGFNEYGQLGLGTFDEKSKAYIPSHYEQPQKIADNVEKVSAGSEHCVIMKTDGSIYTFGNNIYGQLGIGKNINQNNVLTRILEDKKSKDVIAGCDATFVIDESNNMWMCGTMFSKHTSEDGIDQYEPTNLIDNVKMISNHYKRSLVLATDNTLYQYAFNDNSEWYNASVMKITDDVNCISGWTNDGLYKTLVLKNDGKLYKYNLGVGGYELTYVMDDVKKQSEISDSEKVSETTFNDIAENSEEQQKAINALVRAEIISGVSENEFAPNKSLTRAETAALIMRMRAVENSDNNGGFADVTEDKWYYGVAGASKENDIIAGYEDNTFRGDESITKLQLITLISRTLKNENKAKITESNVDLLAIPQWAKEDVKIAIDNGIITNEDLNNVNGEINRADTAVLLYRLYCKI